MRDLLLQCSGVGRDRRGADPRRARRNQSVCARHHRAAKAAYLIRLVWQAGTVAWIGGGVLLIAAPLMASEPARHWIIADFACVFAFAACCQRLGARVAGILAGWRIQRRRGDGGRGVLGAPRHRDGPPIASPRVAPRRKRRHRVLCG